MTFDIDLGKVGITPGGEWNNDSSYERLTLVSRDGASYLSLMDNKGVEPGTDWNVWQLVAAKGADGQDGADGEGGSGTGDTIGVAYYSDGYLYWTKNGDWLLSPDGDMVRASAIDGGGDGGSSAGAAFKSIVFKRSNTTPDTPDGGSFENPTPSGWSDGIPSGESKLWMSARWFYSDSAMTAKTSWSAPAQATDTADIDFEYSSIVSPGTPTTNPSYWHNDGAANDIWMAVRVKKNGVWGEWSVMKVKGEKGEDGEKGADAVAIRIIGAKDSVSELPSDYSGNAGDAYVVNGIIYVWDGDSWQNIGAFQGPPGESNYIFVAFSNDSGTTLTANDGTTPGKYWGYAIVNNNIRPLSASAYTWGKFQGEDGFGYEFIYMKTETPTAPDIPESSNVDEYVPSGWSDDPYDVSEEYPYCWMCMRKKVNGVWGNYIGSDTNTGKAALFAKYGRDGVDGAPGISPNTSYKSTAFIRSSAAIVSAPVVDDTITDPSDTSFSGNYEHPIPYGWSDGIPSGTGKIWMTTRIFSSDGEDPQQSEWSTPKIVSDTETMDYEWSTAEEPGIPSKSSPSAAETNSYWADEPGDVDDPTQIKWMAQRSISNGAYVGDWLVMRIKGEKGEDGTGLAIKGTLASASALPQSGNNTGDAYLIDGDLWIWDGDSWANAGHIQGEPGVDGATPYLHIKYSDDGGAHFTNNGGETPGAYIGIYWDYTPADSSNVSSYTWKKWVGEDGFGYEYIFKPTADNTAPDVPSGTSQADDFVPTGWYDNPPSISESMPYCWVCYRKKTDGQWGQFIGAAGNTSKAALWAHYGKDGASGKGIVSIVEMYAVNNSPATAPRYWETTIPSTDESNKYLWNYEIINYTDGDSITTPPAVIGVYGTGRGISSIVEYYLASASASGITRSSSGWSTDAQSQMPTTIKPFLWNYEVITYTDGTSDTSDPIVIGHYGADGADGIQGIGIDSIDEYYLATDLATGVTKNTTGWTTSVQTINANKPYLWNREVIHFSDGSVQDIQPCIIGHFGEDGTDGRGISSITEHYLASSLANVTRATSGWTTTPQTISASAQYLWNYETVNFSDGTHIDTDPVIIGVYGVATAVDDLAFLRGVFGKDNVSGESGAILRNLIGVTSPSDPTKVIAMLNASSIGEDSTHGKLLIAGGLDGLTAAGINAATFKVYADGHIVAQDGSIGPFTVDGTTLRSEWTNDVTYGSSGQFELDAQSLFMNLSGQGGINRGTFCVGYNIGADPTTINYPVCSVTSTGENTALRATGSANGNALEVYGKSSFVGRSTFTDVSIMGAVTFSGVANRLRRPVYNPAASSTLMLDPLSHHTVIIRNDNVVVNLPSNSLTGDEFIIITSGKAATLKVDGISTATMIGGGSKTDYTPNSTIQLPANYQYSILYNGAEWIITKH